MLQTDARIHRGNSGGPVLDTAGQVIGIAAATSERPTELSFVIPINRVKEILETLRDAGRVERSWLGAMVNPVTAEQAKSLGMEKATGALVTRMMPGSPAAKSALRAGDVVLRWGDRDVDHRSMPWAVAATPPGKPVRVVVWRAGASLELSVTVEPMPQ
jgi:serine protease Do